MQPSHVRVGAVSLLGVLLLMGCGRSTAPEPVTANIREVRLAANAEAAWPGTPGVSGGSFVRIRGYAQFGCGAAAVTAVRAGPSVTVAIGATDADRPCVATTAYWRPYEAEVTGLAAGRYRIRAQAVGYAGEVDRDVDVGPAN